MQARRREPAGCKQGFDGEMQVRWRRDAGEEMGSGGILARWCLGELRRHDDGVTRDFFFIVVNL